MPFDMDSNAGGYSGNIYIRKPEQKPAKSARPGPKAGLGPGNANAAGTQQKHRGRRICCARTRKTSAGSEKLPCARLILMTQRRLLQVLSQTMQALLMFRRKILVLAVNMKATQVNFDFPRFFSKFT